MYRVLQPRTHNCSRRSLPNLSDDKVKVVSSTLDEKTGHQRRLEEEVVVKLG